MTEDGFDKKIITREEYEENLRARREGQRPDAPNSRINPERSREDVRAPLNPEDEALPGNARWYGRLASAVENKWVRFTTWESTLEDRFVSGHMSRKESAMEARVSMLGTHNIDYMRDKMRHSRAINQIKTQKSWMTKFGIGRWINEKRTQYHSFLESRADRKLKKVESKLKIANGAWSRAKETRSFYDERVARAVASAEKRLNRRLEPVTALREKIDARMDTLGESIAHHEQTVDEIQRSLIALESDFNSRPSNAEDRTRFSARFMALHQSLATEEQSLLDAKLLYDRCGKHRMRLANAQSDGEASRDAITERYINYAERNTKNQQQRASTQEPQTSALAPLRTISLMYEDIREEIQDTEVTNERFCKVWNLTFPKSPIKDYKTFIGMIDKVNAQEGLAAVAPNMREAQSVNKFGDISTSLGTLFEKSETFRALVLQASGVNGKPGLELVTDRLARSIRNSLSNSV